ncbi:MAG TPA: DnaJ domain-containing protein [bacterium]|nr:DnaJ domain-containing protein [bacterium]
MDPAFKNEVVALAKNIDELDYYQVLRVSQKSFTAEIKKAYFDQSRYFHPDKYYGEDPQILGMISRIFKRITEAYKVLSDEDKRAAYNKGLAQPDRLRFVRFDLKALEQIKTGGAPENEGQTAMGKKYYQLAKQSINNKDYKSARINLQLAAKMEPTNQTFRLRLQEVEELLKEKKKV